MKLLLCFPLLRQLRISAGWMQTIYKVTITTMLTMAGIGQAGAAVSQFNSTGGTSATNGLHIYLEDTTKIQVRRLNNTGQVYAPNAVPPSNSLDNGVFLRANGRVYGPSHTVTTFNPNGGMYSTYSVGATTPANPSSAGTQQTVNHNFGVAAGPQVSILWKYTTPFDFLTAEVTLTIPTGYAVSAANPVRYYHAFDTYLGGSDNGCGVTFVDANGKRVVGTYPPTSGTTCPSSTSIPAGVSIVESFRERSGLTFSRYCASLWSSFFVNGGTNCSVLQTAQMSNTIATTYQDTGIGIEYDFTSPGTYTFSYDFVVGSPSVPPYDHIEIRHDGSGTLCPEPVVVLACTSSVVPCPVANMVYTGNLTGAVTTTPAAPAVSKTPTTFTVGAAGAMATVNLQGSAPGGAFTLGTSGLSTLPLNGTRCWNTATSSQSCLLTIVSTPCVSNFECMETGVAYNNLTITPSARNPLYTKLAGTNFRFDVVALQSGGVQASSYTAASNVTVELFDDSAAPGPACSAYTSPVASQSITFVAGDGGRKTVTTDFNLPNAYPKLICRVRDTNLTPTVYGCSSDEFSVRPTALTITSSANADSSGTSTSTASPIKAGSSFSMTAASAVAGYNGTPAVGTPAAHSGAVQNGSISGAFGAAAGATGSATGTFTYSEVGYFRFSAAGVYDDTFTVVDQSTDCTNDFSNAAVAGKYGCKFGNAAATSYFGRFIPDHFAIAPGLPVAACTVHPAASGSYTPVDFSYFDQDGFATPFTLTAQNSANGTTQNYAGGFARLGLTTWSNFSFGTAGALPSGSALSASATAPTGSWVAGVASIIARHRVSRPTTPAAPTSVVINALPVDPDGVTLPSATAVASATTLRFGRLRLSNVLGPDTRDLRMPIEAQFWNGTSFVRNLDDSCTTVPASAWSFGNYVKKPAGAVFSPVAVDKTLAGGGSSLQIAKPAGGRVTFDASLNLATTGAETAASSCLKNLSLATPTRPWAPTVTTSTPSPARPSLLHLAGQWCDATPTNNPSARGSFGLYRGAESLIYQRENY